MDVPKSVFFVNSSSPFYLDLLANVFTGASIAYNLSERQKGVVVTDLVVTTKISAPTLRPNYYMSMNRLHNN